MGRPMTDNQQQRETKNLGETLIQYFFAVIRTKWGWDYDEYLLERNAKTYLQRSLIALIIECALLVVLVSASGVDLTSMTFHIVVMVNSLLVVPLSMQIAYAVYLMSGKGGEA